jgi:hypothetical protein
MTSISDASTTKAPDPEAAMHWVLNSIPIEHIRLARMLDAGGDVSEVIGRWAGELATAAHLAGQAFASTHAR